VNVPAADLLAHLAEAAGGEWRRMAAIGRRAYSCPC